MSRLLKLVGDEALRVTVLTLAALEQRGIADPNRHVVVILGKDVLGPPTGTVLARLTPWTEAEVMRIQELAEERGQGLLFAPSGPYEDEWRELAEAESLESFCNGYLLDVCPPTDDKPFFFRMLRLGQIGERVEGYMYATTPFSILIVTLVIPGGAFGCRVRSPARARARHRTAKRRIPFVLFSPSASGFCWLRSR